MPFLNDQEFEDLQQEIKSLSSKNEDLENELAEKEEEIGDIKSIARNRNILLSFLAGVTIATTVYFYQQQAPSSVDVDAIKKEEATRVLDSISNAGYDTQNEYADDYNSEDNSGDGGSVSLEEGIKKVKEGIKDQLVYSVQIGAFTERKYPLLSETIAGTLSNSDYLRYSIGLFTTKKEAQNFRKQLLKLGFRDAFVASYRNGKRQEIIKPY